MLVSRRHFSSGQVALSLVSLVAASLFLRAVRHAYTIDPGFDEKHLAVFMMNPEQVGYDAVQLQAFHREVKRSVWQLPGYRRRELGFQYAVLVECRRAVCRLKGRSRKESPRC